MITRFAATVTRWALGGPEDAPATGLAEVVAWPAAAGVVAAIALVGSIAAFLATRSESLSALVWPLLAASFVYLVGRLTLSFVVIPGCERRFGARFERMEAPLAVGLATCAAIGAVAALDSYRAGAPERAGLIAVLMTWAADVAAALWASIANRAWQRDP